MHLGYNLGAICIFLGATWIHRVWSFTCLTHRFHCTFEGNVLFIIFIMEFAELWDIDIGVETLFWDNNHSRQRCGKKAFFCRDKNATLWGLVVHSGIN